MSKDVSGNTFVDLRKRVGVTQKQIAEAVGVSETSVRNWERGREEPRLFVWQVKALCGVLECQLSELPDKFKSET